VKKIISNPEYMVKLEKFKYHAKVIILRLRV